MRLKFMTIVYLSELSRYDGRVSLLEEGMNEDVILHCKKHEEERHYQASLLAYNVLKVALNQQGIDLNQFTLTVEENGKPRFVSLPMHFNISHSGEIVAVAISTSEVGLDLEQVDDTRDHDSLAKRYFGKKEKEAFLHASNKVDTFYSIWTKKEAFHKHVGDGIDFDTFAKDLPYGDIFTTTLSDRKGNMYYLSVDCIDNEKVNLMIL